MAGSAFQRDRDIRIAAVSDGLEPAAIVLRPHALFSAQLCRLLIRSSADQRKLTLQCLPGVMPSSGEVYLMEPPIALPL